MQARPAWKETSWLFYFPIPILKLNISFPSIRRFCGVLTSPTIVLRSKTTTYPSLARSVKRYFPHSWSIAFSTVLSRLERFIFIKYFGQHLYRHWSNHLSKEGTAQATISTDRKPFFKLTQSLGAKWFGNYWRCGLTKIASYFCCQAFPLY